MDTASNQAVAVAGRAMDTLRAPQRSVAAAPVSAFAVPLRDLLLNAALLAAAHGMSDEVSSIRPVLKGLGMDAERLDVALAIVTLRSGDRDGCLDLLEQGVLSRDAGHELALAVQACAWRLQGREQWRSQAHALLATSADPLVRSVVQARL
jgi:hypothetical protein